MKLEFWCVLLCFLLVSCSGSKSAKKVEEETPQIELTDAEDLLNDQVGQGPESDPLPTEAPSADTFASTQGGDTESLTPSEPLAQDSSLESMTPEIMNTPMTETSQYTVGKNETLMMISFKLYGDYSRWREIAALNQEKLNGGTGLTSGMILTYTVPAEKFNWSPQGNPYLIKTGDTLGSISMEVYSTSKKWKLLWENNRPLIKNPDKIFAGFTIYYPESGREVATEL